MATLKKKHYPCWAEASLNDPALRWLISNNHHFANVLDSGSSQSGGCLCAKLGEKNQMCTNPHSFPPKPSNDTTCPLPPIDQATLGIDLLSFQGQQGHFFHFTRHLAKTARRISGCLGWGLSGWLGNDQPLEVERTKMLLAFWLAWETHCKIYTPEI